MIVSGQLHTPAALHPGKVPQVHQINMSLGLTKYHIIKTYWGWGYIRPHFLNLGSRWNRVVCFTLWPLYHWRKSSQVPIV